MGIGSFVADEVGSEPSDTNEVLVAQVGKVDRQDASQEVKQRLFTPYLQIWLPESLWVVMAQPG